MHFFLNIHNFEDRFFKSVHEPAYLLLIYPD